MNKYDINIDYSRDNLFDELGKKRLKDSYMKDGESSPQERFAFVSSAFASNQEHAQRLYEYSSKHWLSYSTPILAFGRNKNGLPISCYLNYLDDTAEGLVDNLSETNWLSMMGGGVGIHVGIRGADAKSVGVMPHLKTYDASSLAFKQGSTRRGSYATYLDISHPDVLQFLEMRKPTGDQNLRTLNLNHGINITDKFMEIIQECMMNPNADDTWELIQPNTGHVVDTVSAKALWMKIIELRMQTGEPYVWFIDHANKGLPEYQKQLGLKNHGSNLCVAPETLILTDEGYQQIASLEGEDVNVWNGKEFSRVTIKKTGENQKLLKVITNSGFEVECTPYHKFYVAVRDKNLKTTILEKRAHELKAGDKLVKCDFPMINGNDVLEYPYENGLYSAEGCLTQAGQRIYLYHQKRDIKKYLNMNIFKTWKIDENQNREYGVTNLLKSKFFVPNGNYTIESKVKWLEGFLDGDGTVCKNGNTQSIQAVSVNKEFLLEIQMMLQTIGVSSKVTKMSDEGMKPLPANNGSNETKEYFCKTSWRLMFGQTAINTLQSLGFDPKRLTLTDHRPNRECSQFVKISDVVDEGRVDDTFCFTEPNRGMGIFNGILTGQCSEISLVTSKERTAVCCLSSVNLEYFDEWVSDPLFLSDILEMLDNVMTYFVENAPDKIQRAKFSAMRERSVGVGALGYHAYLQNKSIPFESVIAKITNKRIFNHIRTELDKANERLAQERGPCPDAAEFNVMKRCSHVMAIAPNACQSKENSIKTSQGIMTVDQILKKHCAAYAAIEEKAVKQWVNLDSQLTVPTLLGDKNVNEVWYNGVEEVIEIEFEDGNKYKFTENHLLLVRTNDDTTKWVRVGDLTGDEDIVNI